MTNYMNFKGSTFFPTPRRLRKDASTSLLDAGGTPINNFLCEKTVVFPVSVLLWGRKPGDVDV